MEILFYRYNSICEPDILQVFTDFGITVHVEEQEMHNKSITPRECAGKVSEWILQKPLSFVFSINFFPAISYTCERLKVPYVCWSVDSPVPELFSKRPEKPLQPNLFYLTGRSMNFSPPSIPTAFTICRWLPM